MARQRGQNLDEVGPLGRRQARRRLVEQDEARRARQSERDLELALLAIGQLADQPILDGGEVDGVDQALGGMLERVVAARPPQREAVPRDAPAGEVDIVDHRQPGEERGDLIGAPEAAADALMRRESRHVLAEEADHAGARREIAGDAVEQRGLAGAVRAEHGTPLARANRQGDV